MRRLAIHSAAVLAASVLLSGCVSFSPYTAPAGPQASFHMMRPEGEPTGAGSPPHWFFVYDNPDCRLTGDGGFLTSLSWDMGSEAERPLAAGRRLFLRSITKDIRSTGSGLSWTYCTNMTSFVPEAGRRYQARHALTYPGCRLDLVEEGTNRRPASLRLEPVTPRCGQFNQRDDGDTAKP